MVEQEGHLLRFESINANMQPFWLEDVKREAISTFSRASRYRLIQEVSTYGNTINAVIDSGGYDEEIHSIAAKMIQKNRAPTKLLTDDKKWLDRIQVLLKMDEQNQFEKLYEQI